MKKNKISTYIRLQNVMRLVIPLAIVIMILLTIHSMGLVETLFPEHIEYDLIDESKNQYVNTTLFDLRYTGFNYVRRGKIKGGYYYYFRGKTCHFVVLSPDNAGNFADSIDSVTVTGKVTESLEELHDLTTMLAEEINWNAADLSDICSNKILNQTLYHGKMSKMILYTLCLLFAISLGNLIFLLLGLAFPYISLATLRRGNYFKLRKNLISAQKELDGSVRYSGNNMFITDNYFINMSLRNVVVIPLEQIVWMYYHSVLHKKIFFKHTITYTLRLVTDNKSIYSVPHKSKEKCMEAMDVIATMYPEILIGYSEENHLSFLSRINSVLSDIRQLIIKNDEIE